MCTLQTSLCWAKYGVLIRISNECTEIECDPPALCANRLAFICVLREDCFAVCSERDSFPCLRFEAYSLYTANTLWSIVRNCNRTRLKCRWGPEGLTFKLRSSTLKKKNWFEKRFKDSSSTLLTNMEKDNVVCPSSLTSPEFFHFVKLTQRKPISLFWYLSGIFRLVNLFRMS